MSKGRILGFVLLGFFLTVSFVEAVEITLNSPINNQVFNVSNNITFNCSVTSETDLENISFFTDVTGSFSNNQTRDYWELETEANNVLLMHFNNDSVFGENDSFVKDFSSSGNDGTLLGVSHNASGGRMNGSFEFNGSSGFINVPDSDSLDMILEGSIEFWVKYGTMSGNKPVFVKGSSTSDTDNPYGVFTSDGSDIFLAFGNNAYNNWYGLYTITIDQWYHIVFTWNFTDVNMYVNGSLVSSNTPDPLPYSNDDPLWIGKAERFSGTSFFNGSIDELAIYNDFLTAEEVLEHYDRFAVNTSRNWTLYNLDDGTYNWNCFAGDVNGNKDWGNENLTFHVDIYSSPIIESINLSPSDLGEIDPNTNISITVNVSDPSNVSAVILQWKKNGPWINDTMDFNSGTGLWENGTIVTVTDGIYFYRVWSNDTNGFSGVSQTWNVSSEFDYTWTLSPSSLGIVSGIINVVKNIGNITINNTGDDPLDFSITDDWPFAVFYNGSETPSFPVPKGEAINVLVNATFAGQTEERNITINVSATHGTENPEPAFTLVGGVLNSYTGGPFVTVDITSFPASVEQSGSYNFTAVVGSIGNESAENVTLNWSVPSGWSNSSGNLTTNISIFYPQTSNTSALGFNVSSSALSGISTICVNVSGDGVNATDCENVAVTCSNSDNVCGLGCTFNNDDDCSSGDGNGGGAGSGGGVTGGGIAIVEVGKTIGIGVPERISVFRGDKVSFDVNVTNNRRGSVLENVTLEVSGYPETLIEVSTLIPRSMKFGDTGRFVLEVDVPGYSRYGEHEISLIVRGISKENNRLRKEEASVKVVLLVFSIREKEILKNLALANMSIMEMLSMGIYTDDVDELLLDALKALDIFNFDKVKMITDNVIEIRDRAFSAKKMIGEIERMLEEAEAFGIGSPETIRMYSLSLSAFERGDFERAEERANAGLLTYSLEASGRVVAARFIHNYWSPVLGILIVSGIGGYMVRRRLKVFASGKMIKILEREEIGINRMIKRVQERRFDSAGPISRREYKESMDNFERRMAKIQRKKARLRSVIAGVKEDVDREKEYVKKLMIETQDGYYRKGNIGKTAYQHRMRELREEAAIVNRRGVGILKKFRKLLPLVIILLVIGNVSAQENKTSAEEAMTLAEGQMEEMLKAGFDIRRVNDTILEAKALFERGDFLRAEALAKLVGILKDNAEEVEKLIDSVESQIFDADIKGLATGRARGVFDNGLYASRVGNYEEAKELLEQSQGMIEDLEEAHSLEKTLNRNDLVEFLRKNWTWIIVFVIVLGVLIVIGLKVTESVRRVRKLGKLVEEKGAIEKTIKDVQNRYFKSGKMSKSEYDTVMEKHRKSLIEIEKDIIVLNHGE